MTNPTLQGNPNYAAMIVAFDPANVVELPNRDRIVGYKALGYQTLIGKGEYLRGDLLVVFGAETQLSAEYASANNLYRHEHLNADPTARGYLEDNRRVKAISLGGNRSDALAMSLASLASAIGEDMAPWELELLYPAGTAFDHIGDTEICRKYVIPVKASNQSMAGRQGQRKVRVSSQSFPEHVNTPNGFRQRLFEDDDYVVVTQKLHGTSVRIANVPVLRDLRWYERLAKRLGIKVQEHNQGVVVGSRHVTKSIDGEVEAGKKNFYAQDIWTEATREMGPLVPEGFLVYAEVVGWTPDGHPIQAGYTYNVPVKRQAIYIYRVAVVNRQGDLVDLPWRAVRRFAEARGWKTVPEMATCYYGDLHVEGFMDKRYADLKRIASHALGEQLFPEVLPLSDPNTVDEGVVIRKDDGFTPTVAKFKSPIFLGHETALLDAGAADIESVEDEVAA